MSDQKTPELAGKAVNRIKVTLKKQHTHRGQDCKKGAVIEVTERQKKNLSSMGVI